MKSTVSGVFLSILRHVTRIVLKRAHIPVIGVTGSVGKSSCTMLLGEVLGEKYHVKVTRKGNSETGLPLEILGLRDELVDYSLASWIRILGRVLRIWIRKENPLKAYSLLIAEMGIDSPYEPKNMSYLLKFISPDIGIVLNVGPCHTEQFSQSVSPKDRTNVDAIVKAIAKEKMKLVTHLGKKGTAIIQSDNPYIQEYRKYMQSPVISFGNAKHASFRLVSHTAALSGTTFQFMFENTLYDITIPKKILFREYGEVYLAVIAAAHVLGISIQDAIEVLEKETKLPPGRSSLLRGKHDTYILDSSYNSSPMALERGLSFLNNFSWKGKKIAVLGDMRELGPLTQIMHEKMAAWIIAADIDVVILVGKETAHYTVPMLTKRGYTKKLYAFKTAWEVGAFIHEHIIRKGDFLFVKGSQNTIYLETVVRDLLDDPNQAQTLLCRQSPYWEDIRRNFFASERQEQYR